MPGRPGSFEKIDGFDGCVVIGYICPIREWTMRGRIAALGLVGLGLGLCLRPRRRFGPTRRSYRRRPRRRIDRPSTQTNWGPRTTASLGKDPFTIHQFDPSKIANVPAGQVATALRGGGLAEVRVRSTRSRCPSIQPSTGTVTAQGIMHLDVNDADGSLGDPGHREHAGFLDAEDLSYPDRFGTTRITSSRSRRS